MADFLIRAGAADAVFTPEVVRLRVHQKGHARATRSRCKIRAERHVRVDHQPVWPARGRRRAGLRGPRKRW